MSERTLSSDTSFNHTVPVTGTKLDDSPVVRRILCKTENLLRRITQRPSVLLAAHDESLALKCKLKGSKES